MKCECEATESDEGKKEMEKYYSQNDKRLVFKECWDEWSESRHIIQANFIWVARCNISHFSLTQVHQCSLRFILL